MAYIVPSVKNLEEGTHWEFIKLLMRKRQKINSVHLFQKRPKKRVGEDCSCSGWIFWFLEREGVPSL